MSTAWNKIRVPLTGAVLSFLVYSCMYAFRKPFTAATFSGESVFGFDLKIILVICQLMGYVLSKFLGVKIIAEMKGENRGLFLVLLLGLAGFALIGFAIAPTPLKLLFIFLNGIPLGLVWGVVFSYLEGRRATEFMGSVLAVSFIFSSGFVKSVGKFLLLSGISEYWMPVVTASLFFVPAMILVYGLERLPPPTAQDIAERTERSPMNAKERKDFFGLYRVGLIAAIAVYVCLTIVRDYRDNFIADVWQILGMNNAEIFTQTEAPISIAVLVVISFLMFVRRNDFAVRLNHIIIALAFICIAIANLFYQMEIISPFLWMVLNGLGLYMGYIPFNVMFFERIIAATKHKANVGFLMYMADGFGYLGSLGVLLFKNFSSSALDHHQFLIALFWILSTVGLGLVAVSAIFFRRKIAAVQ